MHLLQRLIEHLVGDLAQVLVHLHDNVLEEALGGRELIIRLVILVNVAGLLIRACEGDGGVGGAGGDGDRGGDGPGGSEMAWHGRGAPCLVLGLASSLSCSLSSSSSP